MYVCLYVCAYVFVRPHPTDLFGFSGCVCMYVCACVYVTEKNVRPSPPHRYNWSHGGWSWFVWGVVLGVLVCGKSISCPPILSFMLSQIFAYSYTNFVVKSEGFFYIIFQSSVFVCLSPSIRMTTRL